MSIGSVDYDREADVLYIQFVRDGKVARTVPVDDLRLIDYSADGAVVGLEFIDVSDGVDLHDMPFAQRAEKLIGDAGLDLKVLA